MQRFLAIIFAMVVTSVSATELKPWFGPEKLFEIRLKTLYDHYNKIHSDAGNRNFKSNDVFLSGSAEITLNPKWNAEAEITLGDTSTHSFNFIDEKATLRYLIWDDVLGDPFSITTGLSIAHVHPHALHDFSVLRHARVEFEYDISIGKEYSCQQFWETRWWSETVVGMGIRGYPWIRENLNVEKNWCDLQLIRLFANSLWGLGHDDLDVNCPFPGYAFVGHQSIDLGLRYTLLSDAPYGTISLEYARRVYAKNAPSNVNFLLLTILFPLNL